MTLDMSDPEVAAGIIKTFDEDMEDSPQKGLTGESLDHHTDDLVNGASRQSG